MRPTTMLPVILLSLAMGTATSAEQRATIDADATRQTIEGFGTCLVSWGKVARSDFYNDEMARIYVEDMGFNMLRVNVAPWGMPQIEEASEIRADDIDLDHKRNSRVGVFIDFAKKIQALDPEVRLIGSVWSPPAWMKLNNEITGGKGDKKEPSIHAHSYTNPKNKRVSRNRVKPEYYQHFCDMLAAMADLHRQQGVPFYALSPGNEVMFSQGFESCVWTAEDFATITGMLGETLERRGHAEILLFGPETMTQHNWSNANPLYIKHLKADAKAWAQLDRFATHGYVDGFEADMSAESSLEYWDMIKDYGKGYWMTEGGTGDHEWPAPIGGVASAIHNSLVHGNANAWVPWQVASGNGDRNHHALMAGHDMTKKTHAARHFTRFIPADAVRLHVGEDTGALRVSAYTHADGTLSIVVINPAEQSERLSLALKGLSPGALQVYRTSASEDLAQLEAVRVTGGEVALDLPAQSIVTLSTIDLSTR